MWSYLKTCLPLHPDQCGPLTLTVTTTTAITTATTDVVPYCNAIVFFDAYIPYLVCTV